MQLHCIFADANDVRGEFCTVNVLYGTLIIEIFVFYILEYTELYMNL